MTHRRGKGGVVGALAAASVGIFLVQQGLLVPQHLPTGEQSESAASSAAQVFFCPILFATGWHHGWEKQQHTLAASLSEVDAAAGATTTPLFNEGDCTYPSDDVNFEKVISKDTLRLLLERSPQISYRGVNTPTEAAALMHKDISCAIQVHALFHDFCNTNEKYTDDENAFVNLSECMAFLAHAAVRTSFWSTFSDASQGRECSLSEKYPCGPPSASYHARGPFQLRGNEEYGAFGEAIVQDAQRLLNEPELIEPQGIGGWAGALWKWMSERPYGLNCPETVARSGSGSCHAAMLHQDSPAEAAANALRDSDDTALRDAVAGFGLTIHINGGSVMDCCPAALEIFQRDRALQAQGAAAAAAGGAPFLSAASPGAASAAPPSTAAAAAGDLGNQRPAKEPNQNLPSRQEQLFRAVMSGGDSSLLPPASPGPVAPGGSPGISSLEPTSPSAVTPLTVPFSSSSAQVLLPSSPAQPLLPPASPVALAPGTYHAAVADLSSSPAPPPLMAALLVSTFLSFLGVGLPDVPAATDENAAAVLHPFSSARVPWGVPLPGAADGLCWTQGALTLQAAAENADDKDQGRAAALESRFCLSVVRGCPSLLPKSAAEVSSKSTDEDAAKAVQQAAAKHPDSTSLVFKCFETSPAGFAAAAAEAAGGANTQLPSDDEEKMKEQLNTRSKSTSPGRFAYISRNGVTCAFFSTKPPGL